MVTHLRAHMRKRQPVIDPLVAPTGAGITGATTAQAAATDAPGSLVLDSSAKSTGQVSVPPLALTSIPVLTTTATDTPPTASTAAPDAEAVSSDSSDSQISMGTVIGACVGALAGALILIFIGLYIYKRTAPKRRSPTSALNARGEIDRSRSRLENWDKLGAGEDKWEGQYQTKEVASAADTVGPMEKLTMFKKSTPSTRTAYTHKSYEAPIVFDLNPHPFAQYHPNLAKDMASDTESSTTTVRPFLGRVETGPALSWDSDVNGSFLSLNHSEGDKAKTTPDITSSAPHFWESAEVINYEGESAEIVDPQDHNNNPFMHEVERRKSTNNPFFNAQSSLPTRSPSKSPKGKGRELTSDPFSDQNAPSVPRLKHVQAESVSSETTDRAMRSLIAALDLTPEEVQDRLRVASMQPSIYSNASAFTDGGDELDVTESFPLPPPGPIPPKSPQA